MKKSYLCLPVFLFITTLLSAQNCNLQWKVKSNFNLSEFVTDSLGNSYAIGRKDSTIILITKYDGQGNIIWKKEHQVISGIAIRNIYTARMDKDYNLILIGTYKSVAKNTGIYVLKYLSIGNLGWFLVADNNGKNNSIINAELKTDHLFITAKSDNNTLYLLNYNLTGTLSWSSSYTDPHTGNLTYIKSMTDDANNIYAATTLTGTDSTYITIHKYDIAGNLKWRSLNFNGIAYKYSENLDFFVTDEGACYAAFNKKSPSKSDSIIITGYTVNGLHEFTHNQNLSKMYSPTPSGHISIYNLRIFGNADTYILNAQTHLGEGAKAVFIQYNKNNSVNWTQVSNHVKYPYIVFDSKRNRLVCAGSIGQPQSSESKPIITVFNPLTGANESNPYLSGARTTGLLVTPNNIFCHTFAGSSYIAKLSGKTDEPFFLCRDFFINGIDLSKHNKMQVDKFDNFFIAFSLPQNDTTYIAKYSTALTINEQQDLITKTELYPNPASNSITIASEQLSSFKAIQIINNLGQVVQAQQLNAIGLKEYKITIRDLPVGVYTIILDNGDLKISKSFIKTK